MDKKFTNRLIELKGIGTNSSIGRSWGVSESVVRKYLAGTSEPTRPKLIQIAKGSEVEIEWLVTGEGPMRKPKVPSAGVDSTNEPAGCQDASPDEDKLLTMTASILRSRGYGQALTHNIIAFFKAVEQEGQVDDLKGMLLDIRARLERMERAQGPGYVEPQEKKSLAS